MGRHFNLRRAIFEDCRFDNCEIGNISPVYIREGVEFEGCVFNDCIFNVNSGDSRELILKDVSICGGEIKYLFLNKGRLLNVSVACNIEVLIVTDCEGEKLDLCNSVPQDATVDLKKLKQVRLSNESEEMFWGPLGLEFRPEAQAAISKYFSSGAYMEVAAKRSHDFDPETAVLFNKEIVSVALEPPSEFLDAIFDDLRRVRDIYYRLPVESF